MVLTNLVAVARQARSLRTPLLVVGVSALLAFLFTIATRPDAPAQPAAAGSARIQLLQDEHALIAGYVRDRREAEAAAASASRAEMQAAAVEGSTVLAANAPAAVLPPSRPLHIAQIIQPSEAAPAGPPLQLQASSPPTASRQTPVIQRAKAVLSTVQHIPRWVGVGVREAADWAIIGPAQTIARLPERRFL